jgi:hypothetical protein
MCGRSVDSPVANEFLKLSFRRVHDKIVDSINVGSITDHLFAAGVIGVDDYRSLTQFNIMLDATSQCRRLMSMLYASGHPEAFVMLRRALNREAAYQWLVQLIDEQYKQIVEIDEDDVNNDKSEVRDAGKIDTRKCVQLIGETSSTSREPGFDMRIT